MEAVTGIGGLFFRSKHPEKLAGWYEKNLGISPVPDSYDKAGWQQQAGTTVFAPFKNNSDYFGDDSKSWMINFRVNNLDAMAAQLEGAGIPVSVDSTIYPNGRFARLCDPEGNPIELWEPNTP